MMELKSLNDIFQQRILRIPSYQRGYAWSNNKPVNQDISDPFKNIIGQLKDLWGDILNIDRNQWHYTGLLTLAEMKLEYAWLRNYKQYAIVDGQQRITTLLILIKVLIDKANELKFEYGLRENDAMYQYLMIGNQASPTRAFIFGYDDDNPSDKYFKKHIINADLILDDAKESIYTENLINAKIFWQNCVRNYCKSKDCSIQEKELRDLFVKVTSQIKFNEYILPNDLNAYVVFETMNNRGKPLTDLEKLKNRLMYLNDKLPLSVEKGSLLDDDQKTKLLAAQKKDLSSNINISWTTVYQSLGANKSSPLDDDDLVRNHWIIFFNEYDRSEAKAYSNFIFDEYFIIDNVYSGVLNKSEIESYAKSLQEASIVWNQLNHPEYFSKDESDFKEYVLRLHRVGFRASFKPLVMAILLRKDRESYKPILPLLEEFAFKLFDIADRQSNTGDSKLYRLAFKIYKTNFTVSDAMNEIREHLDYYYSFSLFKNQIDELFATGEQPGYYGWSGLRYFLYEYDLDLRKHNDSSTIVTEIVWSDFVAKNSIEHIYPQSAALSFDDFSYYYKKKDISKAKLEYENIQENWKMFRNLPDEQRWALCSSLGNLLALTSPLNSALSNDCFMFKVDQSLKSPEHKHKGFKYDSMSAQLVAKNAKWTEETIKNRGIMMLDFLWNRLNPGIMNTMTDIDKLNLLGIGFLCKKEPLL
jgi:uncharacterized protein with ParB-like and HNH nuclease domain